LAQLLLVITDAMFFQQHDEIVRRVTGQCRFAEVRVFRNEGFGAGVEVSEVATPTAGNSNFFADTF
jgi:hypothetical protein